jgi:hypothetical protein
VAHTGQFFFDDSSRAIPEGLPFRSGATATLEILIHLPIRMARSRFRHRTAIRPAVLEHYLSGRMTQALTDAVKEGALEDDIPIGLSKEEQAFLRLLRDGIATQS